MMSALIVSFIQHASDFATSAHGRHNSAPDGILYYLVLIASSVIVIAVVIWAIKFLFWPGEKENDHIKRQVLEDGF